MEGIQGEQCQMEATLDMLWELQSESFATGVRGGAEQDCADEVGRKHLEELERHSFRVWVFL